MCAFKNYCKSLAKCKCISNDMPLSPTDMIGDTPVPVCTCLVNYLVMQSEYLIDRSLQL